MPLSVGFQVLLERGVSRRLKLFVPGQALRLAGIDIRDRPVAMANRFTFDHERPATRKMAEIQKGELVRNAETSWSKVSVHRLKHFF